MGKRKRRNFSAEEKVKLIRQHLIDKKPVSEICNENKLNPNTFYRWQTEFFERGHLAFESTKRADNSDKRKIDKLEAKLQHRDGVIAEIMSETIALKKSLGED